MQEGIYDGVFYEMHLFLTFVSKKMSETFQNVETNNGDKGFVTMALCKM